MADTSSVGQSSGRGRKAPILLPEFTMQGFNKASFSLASFFQLLMKAIVQSAAGIIDDVMRDKETNEAVAWRATGRGDFSFAFIPPATVSRLWPDGKALMQSVAPGDWQTIPNMLQDFFYAVEDGTAITRALADGASKAMVQALFLNILPGATQEPFLPPTPKAPTEFRHRPNIDPMLN